MFAIEGASLEFTPGALRLLAERAVARETGARALRAVMEELMIDLMYQLPELDNQGAQYVIDEGAIKQPRSLIELRSKRKESA
jgi:ATP-dependent Clp protease ATP-binding subunit ClpX